MLTNEQNNELSLAEMFYKICKNHAWLNSMDLIIGQIYDQSSRTALCIIQYLNTKFCTECPSVFLFLLHQMSPTKYSITNYWNAQLNSIKICELMMRTNLIIHIIPKRLSWIKTL